MAIYGISGILTYWPAMIKAVKLLGTEDEQGRMFGFREAGLNIFSWVFTQIGVWLIFNRTKGIEGVQKILIFYSIIYFVAAILSFILIPSSSKPEKKQIDNKNVSVVNGIVYVTKMPCVWIIGLSIFCAYSISGAGLGKLTPCFTKVLKIDETLVASLMSFRMYLFAFIAAATGGIIADKIKSASKFIFGAYICLIAGMLLLFLLPGTEKMALMVIVAGFVASTVIYSMRGTYMAPLGQARIPEEYMGTAIGLVSFIGYLPDAFMFSVFGKMMGIEPGEPQFKAIFLVCIVLAVIGTALSVVMVHLIKKRQQTIPRQS